MSYPAHRLVCATVLLFLLGAIGVTADTAPDRTALVIEYWNAFTGTTTHTFVQSKDGRFSIETRLERTRTSAPSYKSNFTFLSAGDLAELMAFLDDPNTERAFAKLKQESIPDGENLQATVFHNSFSRGTSSQLAFWDNASEAEKKLGTLVNQLMEKANAPLDGNRDWLHTPISKVQISAANWAEAMDQFARLRDDSGNEIPFMIYALSWPTPSKPLALSGERENAESILRQLATQGGMSIAIANPIAAIGTEPEVKRFVQALKTQLPYQGRFEDRNLHRLCFREASLSNAVDFLSRQNSENDMTPWTSPVILKCLAQKDRPIRFDGRNVRISEFLSAVAADAGIPSAKLFKETKNPTVKTGGK